MVDELTRNYGILIPKPTDVMNQQVTPQTPGLIQNIRDAFEKLEKGGSPPIISGATLPQVGDYNIGDRIFMADAPYQSNFILLSKDSSWGWVWRPIQCAISPWTKVPATVFSGADSNANWGQKAGRELSFALDNRGNCHWRGAVSYVLPAIPPEQTLFIFANLPNGLRHHTNGMYTLTVDPSSPISLNGSGINGYRGGRWYIESSGYNSLRFHNTSVARDIYFDGIEYPVSTMHYYIP